LAGETHNERILRALAGFLPKESNSQNSIRVDGRPLKNGAMLDSVFLPKDALELFPAHRTIGQFALDISPNRSKKGLEIYAESHGITKEVLYSKPKKISKPFLQKISLWCASLFTSKAVFVEEPELGFCEEIRPFDFLQSMLTSGVTSCIVYSPALKESVLQKAKALQLCRPRIAVFCADRLVEEGDAAGILENPIHGYTKEWIDNGDFKPKKNGTIWQYCRPDCPEVYNCLAKQNSSFAMLDYSLDGLHKVMCNGF